MGGACFKHGTDAGGRYPWHCKYCSGELTYTGFAVEHIPVKKCPRCGGDHGIRRFKRYKKPLRGSSLKPWTHWAQCPKTKKAIVAFYSGD